MPTTTMNRAQEIVAVKKEIKVWEERISELEMYMELNDLTQEELKEVKEELDDAKEELEFQKLELKDLLSDKDVTSAVTVILASFVFLIYSLCLFFFFLESKQPSNKKSS